LTFNIGAANMAHPGGEAKRFARAGELFYSRWSKPRRDFSRRPAGAARGQNYSPGQFPCQTGAKHFFLPVANKILAVWHRPCSNFPIVGQLMPGHPLYRNN
jgi:hypothetical protein